MNPLFILLLPLIITHHMILFDFNQDSNLDQWRIVDDVVMGGRSDGSFGINEAGHGLFAGEVSLENNGGFSSVRYRFDSQDVRPYQTAQLHLKGDGKTYQFRVKTAQSDRHSYIYTFTTSGEWEVIDIPLAEMEPKFRGRALDMPNFPGQTMGEIAFLIGNKKAEAFQLEIDQIVLK